MVKPSSSIFGLPTGGCFSHVADISKRLQESNETVDKGLGCILLEECKSRGDFTCLWYPFPLLICFDSWRDFRANTQSTTFASNVSWLVQSWFYVLVTHIIKKEKIAYIQIGKAPFLDLTLQKQADSALLLPPKSFGHSQSIDRQAMAGSPTKLIVKDMGYPPPSI